LNFGNTLLREQRRSKQCAQYEEDTLFHCSLPAN
jgi:hypothetical protein